MEIKKAFGKKINIGDLDNMSEEVSYNTELLTSWLSPYLLYISGRFPHRFFDCFIVFLDGFLNSIIHIIILGIELIN